MNYHVKNIFVFWFSVHWSLFIIVQLTLALVRELFGAKPLFQSVSNNPVHWYIYIHVPLGISELNIGSDIRFHVSQNKDRTKIKLLLSLYQWSYFREYQWISNMDQFGPDDIITTEQSSTKLCTFSMELSALAKVYCICFNSLWPGDAIWRHGTRSLLAQVMAWCLTAPSHYLNPCWLIICGIPWHSPGCIIIRRSEGTNQSNKIEDCSFKMTSMSSWGQWVNHNNPSWHHIDTMAWDHQQLNCLSTACSSLKKISKLCIAVPSCGEFTSVWWIPRTKGQ